MHQDLHRQPPSPAASVSDLAAARAWDDPAAVARSRKASEARRASTRRRRVDPATCEKDYSTAEMEFLRAIQDYKHRSGRMFLSWTEVLEVVRGLGYVKN